MLIRKPQPNLDLFLFIKEAGIKQRDISFNTGISEASLSRIINGLKQPNDVEKQKIAEFVATVSR
jgi:uncharacterized membrane protein